ncbi:alpha/beta hydrolase [Gordonia sp. X0973]|uniref:alpha/beta fold hydrolase n=1 Tax=Gordonia sp. X0973 TaxID=2742602 RepID=UPI000F521CDA|nr:alpha/beta hydrolase [Gordonia sp. X0973]QKT07952.1 alpha/beta hydrolase [Gordonia sp. X0973]
MTVFEVPGAALSTELSDEGGQAVVQLHGLTSSRARDRVLDLDLGRGLSGTRLLRYDARGHGRSTGRAVAEDYLWPNLADDLLRLLDHRFGGERVYGVGTSMGSGTLMHAAVREPGRFAGLTLLLPPTAWATRVAQARQYRLNAALIETEGEGAFLAAGRDQPEPPAAVGHPETLPEVAEANLPSVFRGAAGSDLPDPTDLARIDVPVRLLAWVDDPSHPLSTAHTLADVFRRSTLTVAETPEDVAGWPALLHEDVLRVAGGRS